MTRSQDELRDLLSVAFECFPTGAAVIGLDGSLLYVNPALGALLGLDARELVGRHLAEFLDPAEKDQVSDLTTSILDGSVDHYRADRWVRRADGSRLRLDVTGAVLRSAGGRPRAVLALGSEIPAPASETNTPAQASVPAPSAPEPANTLREEFESFYRTVSQEFRVPLRIIEGYAEIVVEDCGEGLDEVARRYLTTIRDQSRRLSSMIDHTLSLAKIASGPLTREVLDLTEVAADAAAMVKARAHAHDVDVRIEAGLEAFADSAMVGRLLEQMFTNALRFSRGAANPLIEFGCLHENRETVFFVRDNGAGFDMAAASRLFVPFTTLHEGSEAAGNGVGLAEVRRIVMRHGGRIWADSEPGRGATFYFTLAPPSADPLPEPKV